MGDDLRPNKRQLKKLVKDHAAAVKQDPNNLVARLKLAGALKELGNGREAVEHYQAVAKAYTEGGKLVQAISVYKGILEITPGDAEVAAALTELSSKRAEEVQRKNVPRPEQADGRWIVPAIDGAPEERGSDPGSGPPKLRLPSQQLAEPTATRHTRRSRPYLPGSDGGIGEGSGDPHGWDEVGDPVRLSAGGAAGSAHPPTFRSATAVPREELPSQRSLPSLLRPDLPLSAPGSAVDLRGDPVMEITADEPDMPPVDGRHRSGDVFFEETTSPGPKSYEETIRESAPHHEQAAREALVVAGRGGHPRRTLVGVPPVSEMPPGERTLGAHQRPTPAVPMPAISRHLLVGSSEIQPAPPVVQAGAQGGTRALRKILGADGEPARPLPPPVLSAATPSLEETVGDVFDSEEEAFWDELSADRRSPSDLANQPPAPSRVATRSLKPVDLLPPQRREERLPRATLPLPPITSMPDAGSANLPTAAPTPGPQAPLRAPADPGRPPSAEELKIENIQLFRDISEASRDLLRSRVVTRREKAGVVVVREGDPGHALFVLSSGLVKVTKTGRDGDLLELATLGPGAFFGEFALLSDRRRHATVTVLDDAVFFEISRKVIADLTKAEPAFGNTLRAFYRKRLLGTLVASAPFFSALTEDEREALMGRLRFRKVPEGTKIIAEGEPGGGFFLILIGQVQITKTDPDGTSRVLAELGDGTYFGEMSLLKGGHAVASVTTVAATELVQLAAGEFYRVLGHYPQIWEEVNREAKRRELANLQILLGSAPLASSSKDGVVL